jgi:hypothetical protein
VSCHPEGIFEKAQIFTGGCISSKNWTLINKKLNILFKKYVLLASSCGMRRTSTRYFSSPVISFQEKEEL